MRKNLLDGPIQLFADVLHGSAEIAGKVHLAPLADALLPEVDQTVLAQRLANPRHGIRRQRSGQVHSPDLGAQGSAGGNDLQPFQPGDGHCPSPNADPMVSKRTF